MKTMFGSSLPPVVYMRDHVLFTLFVCVHSSVQHILCSVFALLCFDYLAIHCQMKINNI